MGLRRAAILGALGWIGWERLEMQQPVEDQTTAEAEPDPLQESLDALRDDVATLNEKVDAMMVTMLQLQR